MKGKITLCIVIFIIFTICSFNIVNADEGIATLKAIPSIDEENNLTITLKASNIKLVEGTLDYDSDVIEYIGIEGKNNWQVGQNSLQISMVSDEDTNTEEKDIAVLNFKIVNAENIIDEDITINSVKYIKDDNTIVENRSLKIPIVLDEYIEDDENGFLEDEDVNIEEQRDDDLFDEDTESDGESDYAGDEDIYIDEEEEDNQNSDLVNSGNEEQGEGNDIALGEEENKEIVLDKSISGKEYDGKDATLIGGILPYTGSIIPYITVATIIILAIVNVVVYRKMKG